MKTWDRAFLSLRAPVRIAVVQKTTVSMCPSPTPSSMVALGWEVFVGEQQSFEPRPSSLCLPAPNDRLGICAGRVEGGRIWLGR